MQHRVFGRKLSRDTNERKSLFRSLISSLFTYGHLTTSESKAKSIKGQVDKLITQAKKNTDYSRVQLEAFFQNQTVVKKIIEEIAPSYKNRTSGYSRIMRLGQRVGDQAMMVRMELVAGEPKGERVKEQESKRVETEPKIEDGKKEVKVKSPKSPKVPKAPKAKVK